MGNTDSIPVVSQTKSFVQWVGGNAEGALVTQKNFAYKNTFPVISQIASAGYAIGGEPGKALDLQKKFADDLDDVIDSIPVAGHVKGGLHYALGDNKKGDEAMKSASRSTGVALGGIGGLAVGGPVGAVSGGIAGGAAMDGIITGSAKLINGKKAKPHGYVAMGHDLASAIKGETKITAKQGLHMALVPVSDGLAGYSAAKIAAKPLGLKVPNGEKPGISNVVSKGYRPIVGHELAAKMKNPASNNLAKGNRVGSLESPMNNRGNLVQPKKSLEPFSSDRGKGTGSEMKTIDNHAPIPILKLK